MGSACHDNVPEKDNVLVDVYVVVLASQLPRDHPYEHPSKDLSISFYTMPILFASLQECLNTESNQFPLKESLSQAPNLIPSNFYFVSSKIHSFSIIENVNTIFPIPPQIVLRIIGRIITTVVS